jgi:hypothetical protein
MGKEPTTPQNNPKRPHECFEREVGGNRRLPIKRMETTGFEPGIRGSEINQVSVFQYLRKCKPSRAGDKFTACSRVSRGAPIKRVPYLSAARFPSTPTQSCRLPRG